MNEEGKLEGLPFNAEATKLFDIGREYARSIDWIVGDVLIFTKEEAERDSEG